MLPMPVVKVALPVTLRLPALRMLPVAEETVRLPVATEAVPLAPRTIGVPPPTPPRTVRETLLPLNTTPPVVGKSVVASPTVILPVLATKVTTPDPGLATVPTGR